MKLALEWKLEAENIETIIPDIDQGYIFHFKVICGSCQEVNQQVTLDPSDEVEMSGSRGSANFVYKCKNCKREASASVDVKSIKPYSTEKGGFQQLCVFECRGLEFTEWEPTSPFKAEATSGAKFEVDLSDKDGWTDYDEKSGEPVGVTEVEHKWKRA